jgi:hypothetical protein
MTLIAHTVSSMVFYCSGRWQKRMTTKSKK